MRRESVENTKKPAGRAVRAAWLTMCSLFLLIGVLFLSLIYGIAHISITDVMNALFHFDPGLKDHQIIHDIRLPRILAAAMIGAYLAISGAVMQALTRNPLAEPSLIGVSQGAAFAMVVALAAAPSLSAAASVVPAMIGAGLSVILVFSLASMSRGGAAPVKLALAGMAIGMFLASLTSIIALHFGSAKQLSFWYAGSLDTADWQEVKILALAGAAALPLIVFLARPLTLLNLGDEVTKGLGINLRVVNGLGILAVLLMTGSSVAAAGTISFAGLIIPHISRMLAGPDYRLSLGLSAVSGSLLLAAADLGARMINPPYETPIGVITAVIGVPFFLYLVRSGRGRL
ncbi:FecCD family ABC transporter permease [Peribacillus sp. SCS-37]|uniref:FecCD family ABC transporter permease n=1 Tax=Paraperibacillus esterisolvens TaxID=3115296 RepID=UPI003905DDBF